MIVQFVLSKHDKDVFWSYNSAFQVYYTIMCLGFIDLNSKIRQIISIIIQVALLVWNSGLYQLYTEIYYMQNFANYSVIKIYSAWSLYKLNKKLNKIVTISKYQIFPGQSIQNK